MEQKAKGNEPTVEETILRCPDATWNPETGKVCWDKTIRKVFLEDCHDFDPEHPWRYQALLQKVFLPDDVKANRLCMATQLLAEKWQSAWWLNNIVWIGPCATILPGSRHEKVKQASQGSKRYISDDARMPSRNLQGPPSTLKQNSWGGQKICWLMVLSRRVVHVEVLHQGESVDGTGMASAARWGTCFP